MSKPTSEFHAEFVRRVVENGGTILKANFSLQRGLLKDMEPVFVLTWEQRGVASLQELPWSADLEKYLLFDAHIKMATKEEETERFAAILLNNLASAEYNYGKDYSQSVLVEVLGGRDSDLVKASLARVPQYPPSRDSRSYTPCVRFLKDSIEGLERQATKALDYSPSEATALVDGALCVVLDETFHISAADALFPRR